MCPHCRCFPLGVVAAWRRRQQEETVQLVVCGLWRLPNRVLVIQDSVDPRGLFPGHLPVNRGRRVGSDVSPQQRTAPGCEDQMPGNNQKGERFVDHESGLRQQLLVSDFSLLIPFSLRSPRELAQHRGVIVLHWCF